MGSSWAFISRSQCQLGQFQTRQQSHITITFEKPQILWTNKRQNNQRYKKLLLGARHITCTFNFMRKQRNLGPRHCLSTRLLFSNQTTIPRWSKKLYEFKFSILLCSPNFHKLIVSLKIRENSEFSGSSSLDNMMISPHCLTFHESRKFKTTNIHFFCETEFNYSFFCSNIQFCRFVVSKYS